MLTGPRLRPVHELSSLPPEAFAAELRPLVETAGPLADALYRERPFRSYAELLDRAEALLASLPEAQRVATVNAHPRIGEDAGVLRRTSTLSFREQGYETEGALAAEEVAETYARLAELNQAYESRFGFRFVVFVNRRPKSAIVEVMRERLANPRQQELDTAIREMLAIARDRLRTLTE